MEEAPEQHAPEDSKREEKITRTQRTEFTTKM